MIFVFIVTSARFGPLWACVERWGSPSAAARGGVKAVKQLDGILFAFLRRTAPPLFACLPMVAAVLAVRHLMRATGAEWRIGALLVELLTGAIAYVMSALVLARTASDDLLGLLRSEFNRRRGRSAAPPATQADWTPMRATRAPPRVTAKTTWAAPRRKRGILEQRAVELAEDAGLDGVPRDEAIEAGE